MPRPIALAGLAAAGLLAPANAQVACGFDAPAFHTGALAGQNGWTLDPGAPASFAQVVTSPRRAGNQAARLNQAGLAGDAALTWTPGVVLTPDQSSLDIEWDAYILVDFGYGWFIDLRSTDNIRLGQLWIDGGNIWYRVWSRDPQATGGFLNPGQWGRFKVSVDWAARTTTFYLNGQQIAASGWAGAPSRGLGSFQVASVSAPGGNADVIGLDSVLITPRGVCRADFNGDGFLDFFDYDDFVSCFESGVCPPDRTADFNGDGFADFFDYDDFVAAFEAGC